MSYQMAMDEGAAIEVDWLVVGSGAGGMTSAIVAHELGGSSIVLEKTDRYGGTTALSGGGIWIPNNDSMKRDGLQDSFGDAVQYLSKVIGPDVPLTKIQAYVAESAAMVRFMRKHTLVKYESANHYADYYPELPGGRNGGRTMDPEPISLNVLGEHFYKMRWPDTLGGIMRFAFTMRESREMMDMTLRGTYYMLRNMVRYYLDIAARIKGLPDRRLTLGRALVAGCRRALLDRGIPLWLNADVRELIQENGRIAGVQVLRDGSPLQIRVRRGVLLAAGGMGHNLAMRQQYGQLPTGETFSSASVGDTGDGIRMGVAVGAAVEFMGSAWWTPSMKLPNGSLQALIAGKAMPGGIFVDSSGRRYCNEAAPYEDVTKAQWRNHRSGVPSVPSYLVFDARYRQNYALGLGAIPPGKVMGDALIQREYIDTGFLKKSATLQELACLIDVDPANLEETINRHNEFARSGKDLDFGRGDSASDRYYSDPKIGPNPNLAPIVEAPFYAIPVYPGDLGTKGGLKCDEFARVLDEAGRPIVGLYATGNCAGSVMGDSYPGAGSTIGPSMTFGYVAARHAFGSAIV